MKVLLHYEDNENSELYKSLKITLPKSWKTGPTAKLLAQFVETYNANEAFSSNPLNEADVHLALRQEHTMIPLASDDVTVQAIPDRADVYICHGPSRTIQQAVDEKKAELKRKQEDLASTVACQHFGCKNRFPTGGPYPDCRYHAAPPVFHETAKFWSCCPTKKAYDWDDFQNIPGCLTAVCTEIKDEGEKQFLGGSDLREQMGTAKLKSIDDFNTAQAAGGADAAPILERLSAVLKEFDVEQEIFDQVVEGFKKDLSSKITDEAELLELVKTEVGSKLKATFKAIAADQLRIK